jgi:outer membrane biosynthesis protein TonB
VRTRLEDLIATAERQLASRSFDAAIDSYRTALSEPGAAEAGVEERLDAACRTRDEARGIVRPVEAPPPAPPAPLMSPAPSPPPPAREIAPANIPAAPPRRVEPKPEPAPQPVEPFRTIEPPSFRLLEPDQAEMMDRRDPQDYRQDIEKLSIIDPQPLPEGRDLFVLRLGIAALIFVFVCLLVLLLK